MVVLGFVVALFGTVLALPIMWAIGVLIILTGLVWMASDVADRAGPRRPPIR